MSTNNYDVGKRISIRVTPEEKELIKKYAKLDNLSISDYLKKLALKEAMISNRLEYTHDLNELNFIWVKLEII